MHELHVVLQKTVVVPFYRLNAAFFFVAFILMFGLQSPPTYLISPGFINQALTTPATSLLLLTLLFLYFLKCFNFVLKLFRLPEYHCLMVAGLMNKRTLLGSLLVLYLKLMLPALLYSLLVLYYALLLGQWTAVAVLLFVHLVLLSYKLWFFYGFFRKGESRKTGLFLSKPGFLFRAPASWPLYYLFSQEKVLLLLSKLFSWSMILAFMTVYPYPDYDLRPTYTGFLLAVAGHIMLVRRVQYFQEHDLFITRNLPLPLWQRMWGYAFTFLMLLLPELTLFVWFYQDMALWPVLLNLVLLGSSLLLFLASQLYRISNQRSFYRQAFLLFMGLLLLILCAAPLLLVSGTFFLLSWLCFKKYFFAYEPAWD